MNADDNQGDNDDNQGDNELLPHSKTAAGKNWGAKRARARRRHANKQMLASTSRSRMRQQTNTFDKYVYCHSMKFDKNRNAQQCQFRGNNLILLKNSSILCVNAFLFGDNRVSVDARVRMRGCVTVYVLA